jgi:hypothetical protein
MARAAFDPKSATNERLAGRIEELAGVLIDTLAMPNTAAVLKEACERLRRD